MPALLKVGNAIAAEYVGRGEYGKHNIVNAYAGNIRVQELPAKLQLAFYIELYPHAATPRNLSIELKIGKITRAKLESHFEFELGKPGLILIPQITVDIPKQITIKVIASGEGYKPLTLLGIGVEQGSII